MGEKTTKISALAHRLKVDECALEPLDCLSKQQLTELDEAVTNAMESQNDAIDSGLADALRFIPRPLRGRVAALMGAARG